MFKVDARGKAVGALFEQMQGPGTNRTMDNARSKKTILVAGTLTSFQRTWIPWEQETYARIVALENELLGLFCNLNEFRRIIKT